MKVIVIIPAAGLGTRMMPAAAKSKPAAPKQFTELDGTPVLIHTLRKFAASPRITDIYIAMRANEAQSFRSRLEQERLGKRVHIVEGGEHRQESVAHALAKVDANDDDIVLVHDAVRPFVDQEIIGNVIAAAEKYGAALAGFPAIDTVKQVDRTADGAIVVATLPRERVVLAQTPQGFRFGLLRKAFEEAEAEGFLGTDESSLVERGGHTVEVVMGSARNIKITTPADLELAEFFIAQDNRRKASLTG
jgi:2-C-methyl-D-erythritol 4-phosphate cytidylyltransferase